jgi:hypothetical protein
VIITTNHLSDGIYLPADDRRHFVAWSDLKQADFDVDYWNRLHRWFDMGGNEIVAHYLATLNLADFDAKAPPPKTNAFWRIVDASRTPEDAELNDALDELGRPNAVTLRSIALRADNDFAIWLSDRKNARRVPHRMEECGYIPVRNPAAKDGLWKVSGRRQAIYAKDDIALGDQIEAAKRLAGW